MPISERDARQSNSTRKGSSVSDYTKGKARQVQASRMRRGCNFSTNKRPGHPRGDVAHNLICTSATKRYHPLSFFPLSPSLSLFLIVFVLPPAIFSSSSTLRTPSRIPNTLYHHRAANRRIGIYVFHADEILPRLTNEQIACGWRNKAPRGLPQEAIRGFVLDSRESRCWMHVTRGDSRQYVVTMSLFKGILSGDKDRAAQYVTRVLRHKSE